MSELQEVIQQEIQDAASSSVSATVLTGSVATATAVGLSQSARGVLKHPLIMFGVGMAIGFVLHKYRKNIISSATTVVDTGRDFVLQQREHLEDLIAETKEN